MLSESIDQRKNGGDRVPALRRSRWSYRITFAATALLATIYFMASAQAQGQVVTQSGNYNLGNKQSQTIINGAPGPGLVSVTNNGPSNVKVKHKQGGQEKEVDVAPGNTASVGVDEGSDVTVTESDSNETEASGTYEGSFVIKPGEEVPEVPPTPVDD